LFCDYGNKFDLEVLTEKNITHGRKNVVFGMLKACVYASTLLQHMNHSVSFLLFDSIHTLFTQVSVNYQDNLNGGKHVTD
jgi:hypothetical protein